MADKEKIAIGVDIGGTGVKVTASTIDGILDQVVQPTTKVKDVAALPEQVHKLIMYTGQENNFSTQDIIGVGNGAPGPQLDGKLHGDNLALKGIALAYALSQYYKYPNVIVENDERAKVWSMGKLELIKGMNQDNILVMNPGTGYGTDAIIRFRERKTGKTYYGSPLGMDGNAMEAGHMDIFPGMTPVCACGNPGDLEAYAGGRSIKNLMSDKLGRESSCREAFELYDSNLDAKEIIDKAIETTGIAIRNLIKFLNPKTVFVMGKQVWDYTQQNNDDLNYHIGKMNPKVMLKGVEIIVANRGSPFEKLDGYASAMGPTSLIMPNEWVSKWNETRPWEKMDEMEPKELPADYFRNSTS